MAHIETIYKLRLMKSTGGFIEYTFDSADNTVFSPAVAPAGSFDLAWLERNLMDIAIWKDSIYKVIHPVDNLPPDYPAHANYGITASEITADLQADNMRFDFTYNRSTKQVTAAVRPAFTVSWSGFLFVTSALFHFLSLCRETWREHYN